MQGTRTRAPRPPGVPGSPRGARRTLVGLSAAFCFCGAARASDYDVIINEIHYNVFAASAEAELEFVELHNLGPVAVDLGNWSFTRGIDWTFPAGFAIAPGEYLVLSPDPPSARAFYGLDRVLGPYSGRLENAGEILELVNDEGRLVSRVHYDDEGSWPTRPDGRGPSLEFTGQDNGNDQPWRWQPSRNLGGTPGRVNSRLRIPRRVIPLETLTLVDEQGLWRTFRGLTEPSDPPTAWTESGFDDSSWESLPGGFGYGFSPVVDEFRISTTLDDMRGNYTSFFVRHDLEIDASTLDDIASGDSILQLRISFDDAYVAYVNGIEIARENVGSEGVPVPVDGTADSSRTTTSFIDIDPRIALDVLLPGGNVLGIHGLNREVDNRDFYIGASLLVVRVEIQEARGDEDPYLGGILNEIRPRSRDGEPGFVEIHNPYSDSLDMSGRAMVTDRRRTFEFPPGTILSPGTFLVFYENQLGFTLPSPESRYAILDTDHQTLLDEMETPATPDGASAGRFPDGSDEVFVLDTSSPGRANERVDLTSVIINEIHYHPPAVPPTEDCQRRCSDRFQWIELHNRGTASVDLGGWRLARAVELLLPASTVIPAGGFVVLAASAGDLLPTLSGDPVVIGDWSGRLNHASETIELRDSLGNLVDRVTYSDGGPVNDLDPSDGIDDGTFRGSFWPRSPDGQGHSLELIHPGLDNSFALSWHASLVEGGTPGAENFVTVDTPPPVVGEIRHHPLVPRPDEPVRVTCRIFSVSPITDARVLWSVDGNGGPDEAFLVDTGTGEDERAGDGIFTAHLPGQAQGDVVRFRVVVSDTLGATTEVPLPPAVPPHRDFEGPFFLYEIDASEPPPARGPVVRIVMTASDRAALQDRSLFSDILLPATFITEREAYHLVGLRFRGENSRREPNRSYRVEFHSDRRYMGTENLNLNAGNGGQLGTQTVNEILSSDLLRRAGAPYPMTWPLTLHFAGEVGRTFDTRYIYKENLDEDFIERLFGASGDGNLYRARNPGGGGNPSGDLRYRGDETNEYRSLYQKKSNRDEDDYSDVIELCRAFDPQLTPDDIFVERLEALIDPREWAQFFALQDTFTNSDGGIWNNNGEDYALYRFPDDSPLPQAGKWWLISWDLEETFSDTDMDLFRVSVPTIRRFLRHPRFARLYYDEILRLAAGAFSVHEMRKRFGPVAMMFPAALVSDVVDPLERYVAQRLAYYRQNIPTELLAGVSSLSADGGLALIEPGDTWRFYRGSNPVPGDPAAWTLPGYDDRSWEEGPSGFGYGDGDDATELTDMPNTYTTVFVRRTFDLAAPEAITSMTLIMDYDDAYVAYLNGVEVARAATAPDGIPSHDSTATTSHEASHGNPAGLEITDLAPVLDLLVPGPNLLAIVGLNRATDSSDFSLIPALSVTEESAGLDIAAGCGDRFYVGASNVRISGRAHPVTTRSVLANSTSVDVRLITSGGGPYGAVWDTTIDLPPPEDRVTVRGLTLPGGQGIEIERLEIPVERLSRRPTAVPSALSENAVWTRAGGPYDLRNGLRVPAGVSLFIEAGTTILAGENGEITVEGLLMVNGRPGEPVIFRSASCDRPWRGISLMDTGTAVGSPTHTFRYTVFERGVAAGGNPAFVRAENARLLLEDCVFRDIDALAIGVLDAFLSARSCEFETVRGGVFGTTSTVRLNACRFHDVFADRDAVRLVGSSGSPSRVAACTLGDVSRNGVRVEADAVVEIADSVFTDISHGAISVASAALVSPLAPHGNVTTRSGAGISIQDGSRVEGAHHNTVVGCERGLLVEANAATEASFHSVIIWGNTIDVETTDRSNLAVSYSNIGGQAPWPGEGNISQDPRFVDAGRGDFSLAADSPCAGTGRGGSDMGAIPAGPSTQVLFIRGDIDRSTEIDITDVVISLDYMFLGGDAGSCLDRLDLDDNGAIEITDPIYSLTYEFLGGEPPRPPFPEPGTDPSADGLECTE